MNRYKITFRILSGDWGDEINNHSEISAYSLLQAVQKFGEENHIWGVYDIEIIKVEKI